jgi:hypothetical protein
VKKIACGEYPAYLFLLLSDKDRFVAPKTNLDNNFLVGEQKYFTDVSSAKRLITDYVPIGGAAKPRQK